MRKTMLPLAVLLGITGSSLAQRPTELKGHTGYVYSVAFSPDGKLLASGSFDSSVKLWDYPSGKEIRTLKGHTAQVYSVAFSPKGDLLASGSQDKTVRLWDPKDGKTVKELKGHGDIVQSVAFSPDGKLLATASADKTVRLWDPSSGKEVKNLGSHKKSAYCVAFSPDGKLLASCSEDTFIKLWDVAGQKEVGAMSLTPPQVAKDPKDMKKPGDKKDTKKDDKKDPKDTKKEVKVGPPPEVVEAIFAVQFTPDNASVVSCGLDHFVRVWGVADRKPVKAYGPAPDYLNGLALSKDGKSVATAGYSGNLRVWDLATGKVTFEHQVKKYEGRNWMTYCVAWAPDGRALVSGGEGDNGVVITPLMAAPPKK